MANESFLLALALLCTALLRGTSAWDLAPTASQCQNSDTICITSLTSEPRKDSFRLSPFSPRTYTWYNNENGGDLVPLLFWESPHTLQWTQGNTSHSTLIEWEFSDGENAYTWSRTFTNQETSFEFTFKELAESLSNDTETNLEEIKRRAAKFPSVFKVSQPQSPTKPQDVSGSFYIIDEKASSRLQGQKAKVKRDDEGAFSVGAGVGVGIGFAVLAGVAIAAGWYFGGKKKSDKTDAEQAREVSGLNGVQFSEVIHHGKAGGGEDAVGRTGERPARKAMVYYR